MSGRGLGVPAHQKIDFELKMAVMYLDMEFLGHLKIDS